MRTKCLSLEEEIRELREELIRVTVQHSIPQSLILPCPLHHAAVVYAGITSNNTQHDKIRNKILDHAEDIDVKLLEEGRSMSKTNASPPSGGVNVAGEVRSAAGDDAIFSRIEVMIADKMKQKAQLEKDIQLQEQRNCRHTCNKNDNNVPVALVAVMDDDATSMIDSPPPTSIAGIPSNKEQGRS